MDGKLMVVTSSPGTYDTIYVGFVTREGDMIRIDRASMVLRYEQVGVPGIASQPEYAVRLRPADGAVYIPIINISAMVVGSKEAWEPHLGISRDN